MLLSRLPRAEPSRLAWLSRIPIAVTSGRINRNLAHYYINNFYLVWFELVGGSNFTNTRRLSDSRVLKIPFREFCFSRTSTYITCSPKLKQTIHRYERYLTLMDRPEGLGHILGFRTYMIILYKGYIKNFCRCHPTTTKDSRCRA